MTYTQLIKHFKTQTAAAAALKYNQSSVANWKRRGSIPLTAQVKVEHVTKGKLKVDKRLLSS